MVAHTPGPWTVRRTSQQWVIAPEGGGDVIARVIAGDLDFTRRKGNARLIAAAPDMYQCLYDLLGLMATIDVSAETQPAMVADLIRGNVAEITRVMRAARGGLDEWGQPYPSDAERNGE